MISMSRWPAVRDPSAAHSSDLVDRNLTVTEPNRLWVTDITEHPTKEGTVYCAPVMDSYSRLIVGWSIAEHMRTELVTDALGMAVIRRQPDNQPGDKKAILGHDATRVTRHERMADPRRARQCHRRVDRILVQPKRRRSRLGMHSPVTFETLYTRSDQDH
jgi:putative transposase